MGAVRGHLPTRPALLSRGHSRLSLGCSAESREARLRPGGSCRGAGGEGRLGLSACLFQARACGEGAAALPQNAALCPPGSPRAGGVRSALLCVCGRGGRPAAQCWLSEGFRHPSGVGPWLWGPPPSAPCPLYSCPRWLGVASTGRIVVSERWGLGPDGGRCRCAGRSPRPRLCLAVPHLGRLLQLERGGRHPQRAQAGASRSRRACCISREGESLPRPGCSQPVGSAPAARQPGGRPGGGEDRVWEPGPQ